MNLDHYCVWVVFLSLGIMRMTFNKPTKITGSQMVTIEGLADLLLNFVGY